MIHLTSSTRIMQRSIELLRSSMTSLNKLWNSLSSLLQDRNVGYISSYLHSTAWCNDKLALRVHGNVCWTVQYLQSKRWAGTVHFAQARSQVLRVRENIQFHGAIFLLFSVFKTAKFGVSQKICVHVPRILPVATRVATTTDGYVVTILLLHL